MEKLASVGGWSKTDVFELDWNTYTARLVETVNSESRPVSLNADRLQRYSHLLVILSGENRGAIFEIER